MQHLALGIGTRVLLARVLTLACIVLASCAEDQAGPATLDSPLQLVTEASYFVAPAGDDDNPGTFDRPFGTLERGILAARPGDTILVRGGTYVENIMSPSIQPGTRASRITLAAYPGERPVVRGLLWLKGADYWTVDGISVTWNDQNSGDQHMVKMTNGIGWILTNAEISDARSYAGLLVVGDVTGEPSDWLVSGNCIRDTHPTNGINQDHNVYINTGLEAGSGVFASNVVFNAPNGENVKVGGPRSAPDDGSGRVTISRNTLYSAAQPILLSGGTHSTLIENNIVAEAHRGWLARGYLLTGENNIVRSNVGYGADEWILNDPDFRGITDGGDNVMLDPRFDSIGCQGFTPTASGLEEYGR